MARSSDFRKFHFKKKTPGHMYTPPEALEKSRKIAQAKTAYLNRKRAAERRLEAKFAKCP